MKKSNSRFTVLKQPPGKPWEHIGGGCLAAKIPFPCDDTYEHVKTKKRINITCTMEAHFSMPDWVRKPSDLSRRAGVNCTEVLPPFPEDP
jgi:hypothetical protein